MREDAWYFMSLTGEDRGPVHALSCEYLNAIQGLNQNEKVNEFEHTSINSAAQKGAVITSQSVCT